MYDLGRRIDTKPGMPQSQTLKETLKSVLDSVSASLKAPVAKTDVEIDLRSEHIRMGEVCFSKYRPAPHDSLLPQLDGFE